jgi:hypothetical protein
MKFHLEEIELGEDARKVGVAVPSDDGGISPPQASSKKQRPMTKAARIARKALQKAADEVGSVPPASNNIPSNVKTVTEDQWRKYAYASGISTGGERAQQGAFQRGSQALVADSLAGSWQGHFWPCS